MPSMTAASAASQSLSTQSDADAGAVKSQGNFPVMVGAFVLMVITLLAGMPLLSLAFFGASAGNVFSLLINHRHEIAEARANLIANKVMPWY